MNEDTITLEPGSYEMRFVSSKMVCMEDGMILKLEFDVYNKDGEYIDTVSMVKESRTV